MSWSSEQTSLLIELYEKHPCLYVIKHPDYHNKYKRSAAISNIVEAMRALKPTITEQDVLKKFLGLRTTYAQERRKVLDSFHSGMGEDEVYHPTLWYYEKLSYLQDHLQPRNSRSSFAIPDVASHVEDTVMVDETQQSQSIATIIYEVGDDGVISTIAEQAGSDDSLQSDGTRGDVSSVHAIPSTSGAQKRPATASSITSTPKRTKKQLESQEIDALKKVSDNLGKLSASLQKDKLPATAEDIMGQFVAAQLKKINNDDIKQDVYFEIHKLLRDAIKKDKQ